MTNSEGFALLIKGSLTGFVIAYVAQKRVIQWPQDEKERGQQNLRVLIVSVKIGMSCGILWWMIH